MRIFILYLAGIVAAIIMSCYPHLLHAQTGRPVYIGDVNSLTTNRGWLEVAKNIKVRNNQMQVFTDSVANDTLRRFKIYHDSNWGATIFENNANQLLAGHNYENWIFKQSRANRWDGIAFVNSTGTTMGDFGIGDLDSIFQIRNYYTDNKPVRLSANHGYNSFIDVADGTFRICRTNGSGVYLWDDFAVNSSGKVIIRNATAGSLSADSVAVRTSTGEVKRIAPLNTLLASYYSGSVSTNWVPKIGSSNTLTQSNISDDGTVITLLSSVAVRSNRINITPGTLTTITPGWQYTATLPSATAADEIGASITTTSAGSTAVANTAFTVDLAAGYTGSSITLGFKAATAAASTGGSLRVTTGLQTPFGNTGASLIAYGTTTGFNMGSVSQALNGNTNIAVVGKSVTTKNSAVNVGGAFFATNAGTSPTVTGLYIGLGAAADPTYANAGLLIDNGATTYDLINAKANGTSVFKVFNDGSHFVTFTTPPATAASTGTTGTRIYGTDGYLYVCTASNTWKRVQLTTW